MDNKKIYFSLVFFLVCVLSIQLISATENTANEDIISTDYNKMNNLETNIQYDDVSTSKENSELSFKESNYKQGRYRTDKTTTVNEDPLTFTDLNTTINDNTNSTIYLFNNYKYNNVSDNDFRNGIVISRDLTIYGNGVTLDGSNMASIFNVSDSNFNVNFYNINFINGNASYSGGAIIGGNAYNCIFVENTAIAGGAIYEGNAYNCTFTGNKAPNGGAINNGNATNCKFNENSAVNVGGAIYMGNAYDCIFVRNNAKYGGAIC